MNFSSITKQILKPHLLFVSWKRPHSINVKDIVSKHTSAKAPNWESLREECIQLEPRRINATNVDYHVLSSFVSHAHSELALDYVAFLRHNGKELNLAATSKLLQVYAALNRSKQQQGNVEIEESIINIYKELLQKWQVFDITMTESLVIALSTTKLWKTCLKLFEQLKQTSTPTTITYSALIRTLFEDNNTETAWKYLQELVDLERKPPNECYDSYLKLISQNTDWPTFQLNIEVLLEFWSNNDVQISAEVAQSLMDVFRKYQKKTSLTKINLQGDCPICKSRLPATVFNADDFHKLKTTFFNRVIVGKDVFRKSTPTELEAFKRFLQQNQKFDVIIDGLNVAFSAGAKQRQDFASQCVEIVARHYAMKNMKVLVLGRSHMNKWSNIATIKHNAKLFLTHNITQDDPYLLYCALNSGQGTIIVSRDLMRGHLYLLQEPAMKQLFKQWLSISQHKLIYANRNGKVLIETPPTYIQSAQKCGNVWHLPCEVTPTHNDQQSRFHRQPSILWLCVQL